MPDPTDWLPELECLNDHGGNWKTYCEALYAIFKADFVDNKPAFASHRVGLKRYPVEQEKEATFWHFISEGRTEADRTPDFRRCERIRWPKPMMEAFREPRPSASDLLWWKEERRGEWSYVLSPTDFSYKLVVRIRKDFVLPWTAYTVEQSHQRRKMQRAYDVFWEQQDG